MRILTPQRFTLAIIVVIVLGVFGFVFGAENSGGGGQGEEILEVLIALVVILLSAKLGGDLIERIHQPAVLGELGMGMIIGNVHLLGWEFF